MKNRLQLIYHGKNVIINDINYTQPYNNIKYSLPIKYSVQNNPVKYSKPKTIYSSMTTKRNYDMLGLDNGKRQLNSLYYKYGMYLK